MLKRALDIAVAAAALTIAAPIMAVAAAGIRLASPGPIFYRARRIARDRRAGRDRRSVPLHVGRIRGDDRRRTAAYYGREFTMLKFRTMRLDNDATRTLITAADDSRIFPFGAVLRATKIDELPQLLNVLNGDMSLVGPRPEDPEIVRRYYGPDDLQTLQVLPGVTSPGTIYYYTHCESSLAADQVMEQYVERLMPLKLALDRVYIRRSSIFYDLRLLARTAAGVGARIAGLGRFPDPPELAECVRGSHE